MSELKGYKSQGTNVAFEDDPDYLSKLMKRKPTRKENEKERRRERTTPTTRVYP